MAALKYLPQGGLYLTGGLTPKNIDMIKLADGPFIKAFRDKVQQQQFKPVLRVLGSCEWHPGYNTSVRGIGGRFGSAWCLASSPAGRPCYPSRKGFWRR